MTKGGVGGGRGGEGYGIKLQNSFAANNERKVHFEMYSRRSSLYKQTFFFAVHTIMHARVNIARSLIWFFAAANKFQVCLPRRYFFFPLPPTVFSLYFALKRTCLCFINFVKLIWSRREIDTYGIVEIIGVRCRFGNLHLIPNSSWAALKVNEIFTAVQHRWYRINFSYCYIIYRRIVCQFKGYKDRNLERDDLRKKNGLDEIFFLRKIP